MIKNRLDALLHGRRYLYSCAECKCDYFSNKEEFLRHGNEHKLENLIVLWTFPAPSANAKLWALRIWVTGVTVILGLLAYPLILEAVHVLVRLI